MMHILFYIFAILYYFQLWFTENFNPVGKEFTNLVILGLLAILQQNTKGK
jgi:hypothetical protein